MSNTTPVRRLSATTVAIMTAIAFSLGSPISTAADPERTTVTSEQALSAKQQTIVRIAAAAALGDMSQLDESLNQGLDSGLTVSEAKEILVQLYAYTGFPRSLNALGQLMKVLDARKQRGVQDAPGRGPAAAIPTGKELLALGTANQTELSGTPVRGPLFEFSPQVDEYLKTHLFGDIFGRDNLDWQSRELATVSALAAMSGVESQLQSHVRISLNVGLTGAQLSQLAAALAESGQPEAARRAQAAIQQVLPNLKVTK